MLDEDNEGYGLNMYSEKCSDPSSTNAINSSIFPELKKISEVILFI